MVYGAVAFWFIVRFVRFRKWPSFYLAISAPLAWSMVALWDLGIMEPNPTGYLRWAGVLIGLLMLTSVVRWDRIDNRKQDRGDPTE